MLPVRRLTRCKFLHTTRRVISKAANKFDADYLGKNGANYAQLSPVSQLKKTVNQYPSVVCYVHSEISRTWIEVDQRIKRFASVLTDMGITKNDVVSIIAPNSPSIFEAHFAVPSTGAVLHSLNTRSDARTIAFQLQHAETKVLLVDTEYASVVESALAMMENPQKILIVQILDDLKYPLTDGFKGHQNMEYEDFLRKGRPTDALNLPDDEWDAISLNYTSGTTGNPKGVVSHHRGAYLNSLANMVEWNMPLHPRFLWIVPMFHCNGWCFPWTMAAAAGAPPPTSVIKRFNDEIGIEVQCAYGLTETYGPICTHNADREWLADDSAGTSSSGNNSSSSSSSGVARRPLSAHELLLKSTYLSCDTTVEDLKILDPVTMLEVPADGLTVGEVMVRGNVVMKGYLSNEAATRAAFAGGWFHTGDLAVHHGNGRIEIKDRSKDIIISGGENISSIEVEAILLTHRMIDEAAVIAVPDEKWGEVPCAYVTLRADSVGLGLGPGQNSETSTEQWRAKFAAEMIVWARTKMAGYQTPKKIRVVDSLPKTVTGKVQKNVLREMSKAMDT